MIRLGYILLLLLAVPTPAVSETSQPADPYAPAKEIIREARRIVTPNGVEETFTIRLGGVQQVVNVRGNDRNNPLLLFVHGGPGAVEMPFAWHFQRPWEDFFTVVQWDQRAAGRSYRLGDQAAIGPTLTLDRYRDDAIELIEALNRRYNKRCVLLLGHSWGSLVGLSVAEKRPDLLHAYIGMGQLIDFRENERIGYEWTLGRARQDGNAEAIAELEALKPYPGPGAFDVAKMTTQRKWSIYYGGLIAYHNNADWYFRLTRLSPDYTPADREAWGNGSAFTISTLFPQLSGISKARVRRIDTPIILMLGRHDFTTPSEIARQWFDHLQAPAKEILWFEHSAHLPMIEEPGRVLDGLLRKALPLVQEGCVSPKDVGVCKPPPPFAKGCRK